MPLFNLGFKDEALQGFDGAKKEAVTEILLEIIAGDASPLYRRLYDKGIINGSFSMQYFSGRSFAATVIGGESRDPDAVAGELTSEIKALTKSGIKKSDFDIAKKSVYGRLAAHYDSVDDVANGIAGCRFAGIGPFDTVDAAAQVTLEDVNQRLRSHFSQDKCSLSIVLPMTDRP